jgi:hypothetical protein
MRVSGQKLSTKRAPARLARQFASAERRISVQAIDLTTVFHLLIR